MKVRKIKDKRRSGGETDRWFAVFPDHAGAIRRLALFDDRKASEAAAKKIERIVCHRSAADPLPPDLALFVESLPVRKRQKLVDWGLLEAESSAVSKTLLDHLKDWSEVLMARGNTAAYSDLTLRRLEKVFEQCGAIEVTDITSGAIERALGQLGVAGRQLRNYLKSPIDTDDGTIAMHRQAG